MVWGGVRQSTGWTPEPRATLTGNSYNFSKEFVNYGNEFPIPGSLSFEIKVDKIANYHKSLMHPSRRGMLPPGTTRETMIRNLAVVLYASEIKTQNAWNHIPGSKIPWHQPKEIKKFDDLSFFTRMYYLEEARAYIG